METIKLLESIVISRFNQLQKYTKAFNEKAQADMAKIISSKDIFNKDPETFDLDEIGKDILLVNGFHQVDIRKMQEGLLMSYTIFREAGGDTIFEKDLEDTIGILRASLPKQFFVYEGPEKGFLEIEEGKLEKAKSDYRKKGYYKMYESRIKQLLTNE